MDWVLVCVAVELIYLCGQTLSDSHSDLHNLTGELPMTTNVPGHEGIGRVVRGLSLFIPVLWIGSSSYWLLVGPDTAPEIMGKQVGVKCVLVSDEVRVMLIGIGGCIVPAESARHARYSIRTVPIRAIREE